MEYWSIAVCRCLQFGGPVNAKDPRILTSGQDPGFPNFRRPNTPTLHHSITPSLRSVPTSQYFIHDGRTNEPILVWLAGITGNVTGAFISK